MMAQWTYRQAWLCLVGSTFATLSISLGGFGIWKKWQQNRLADEHYRIVAIVQTGPEKEALKSAYLAELLDLSADRSVSLYAYSTEAFENKLLACPLISEAKVKKIEPGVLYIDYTIRHPVAWLTDYQNIALDSEGYIFPVAPFYSPKNLPEIYLGLPPFQEPQDTHGRVGGQWQVPIKNNYLPLAFDILRILSDAPWREGMRVKRIDVSNAFAPSSGQREIVLLTEDELLIRQQDREIVCIFPKILRLPSKNYYQQLSNFLTLRRSMMEDYRRQISQSHFTEALVRFSPRIIDLRIAQTAYVQNN